MTLRLLSRLLIEGSVPGRHVARRVGQAIDAQRFADDVGRITSYARRHRWKRVVLSCRDSYLFAAGLFGLLHAGSAVILISHGQPGTIAAEQDGLIDDTSVGQAGESWGEAFEPIDTTNPLIEFFTSGSSGTPKRIAKTLGQLEREVAIIDHHWGMEAGHGTVHATVSHQHAYGLPFKILWPLSSGRAFAAETHEIWESLLPALGSDDILISSPAHLGRLGGLAGQSPERCPGHIFSAGAPLAPRHSLQAEAVFGRRPIEIFGSTENGVMASRVWNDEDPPWRALHGVEIECSPEGSMRLRSSHASTDGWHETTDLIELVPNGFRSKGRSDRIAKIEGARINLDDVEGALLGSRWVAEAVALVLPEPSSRLAAIVVPNAAGREALETLGSFRFGRLLRQTLHASQIPMGVPKSWRFVEQLPAQPLGKRRQADLLAVFEGVS